ncbi:transporter substrate-binding domain-containing protein [Alteromonas ponticola]|uniref:Transporter substrate-binding domain-containing protein n=1 Tax=Alteromonas aquimaris TaxID=2998417 RepID=A0ABT3P7G6_9ALTE|nr:transporter substrate-binding domain-containing protein [Alteromonas aquimaris]MCW8108715.1 transporter substrate-binding domain-containing protein [Alteromonas aquimaris]
MKYGLISVILIFVSFSGHAEKEPLLIAVNLGPPWAYYDDNDYPTGIEVETIRAVFNEIGYSTRFVILPYNRLIKAFNEQKLDFASPAAFASDVGTRTIRYLPYHDVAITRKADAIKLDNYRDLRNKRIVAYQHALQVLGQEFEQAVSLSNYIELAERKVQVKLLAFERTDVVVGESRLLHYILNETHPELAVTTHPIFPVKHYGGIALEETVAHQFDEGVQRFIEDGKFDALLKKWDPALNQH